MRPRRRSDDIFPVLGGYGRGGSGLREHSLELEGDGDVFAQEHAAGLERGVVGEAEVLAVDLGLRGRAGLVVAVRVLAEAAEVELERDRLGDALDGQVAVDEEVAALSAHAGRDELDGRV